MKKVLPICILFICVIIAGTNSGFSQVSGSAPENQEENRYRCEDDLIEVMFIESSRVRLRNGQLTDLKSDATAGLNDLLSQIEWYQWFRFCSVDESEIDQWSVNGERNTGNPVYNLNNIYRLQIPKGYDVWVFCGQLEALPGIYLAIPVPKPVPPPSSPPPPVSFQSQQGYLNSAASTPTGVDAIWAWTQTGGTGSGVTICDLEYSWNYNHAGVTKALNSQINPNPVADPFNDDNHGTAVIGEIVSDNNGWGTTGISYGSGLKTCGTYYYEFGSYTWNPAGAIGYAISNLSAGDIILLEQQWEYTQGAADYIPLEWYGSYSSNPQYNNPVYAAIVNAVSNGIHVVEAGGNGNVNTDNLTWYGNSGAIIVGAGGAYSGGTWAEGDLQRLSYSSYGQRFDLQGWGEDVVTTGYGNLYSAEGKNYWYTNTFSGTSSASPIVAGAVACVQGYYLANISTTPFSPSAMRSHLATYGTAQITPPSGNIGPRPNIRAAIENLPQPPTEYDWGDAPDGPYPTLFANSGPRHLLDGVTFLGLSVDAESDGQPNSTATGDDNDGNNDDDGVVFTSLLIPGQTATVQVTASVSGILNAWIDFNQLNVWSDPGEFIFQNVSLNAGVNNLSFFVPFNAIAGNTFARFRFSSTGGLLFYGAAPDGEVEDYMVYIGDDIPPDGYDWGDAPDPTYPTLAVNNGARHQFLNGYFLGNSIDTEPDGQPDPLALGDDNNGIDDEDGVVFNLPIIPGNWANVTVTASAPGILNAWIDLNFNGTWGDPGEHIFVDLPIAMGPNLLAFPVPLFVPTGNTFARFRFSSVTGLSYTGLAPDGEVEDYMVFIGDDIPPEGYDWGDAPDGPYPTMSINNGAHHMIIPGFFLGNSVDPEPDGQSDPTATGDDNDGNNDDDGVIFTSLIIAGQIATVDVIASAPGILNAWIDFDFNGSWAEPFDHIFIDFPLNPGLNNLTFTVPNMGITGNTFTRFRFSGMAGLPWFGSAPDGEVEDYMVYIGTPPCDIQMDPDPMMAFVQNEVSMAIVPSPTGGLPTVLLAAYNDHPYPGGPGLGVSYSHDAGTTWIPQQLQYPKNPLGIAYADAFDPAATADALGNLYVAHISTDYDWTNGPESGLYVHKSIDGGMTWQAPVQIAYDAKPAGSPDPNYRFNDRCQITCDLNPGSPFYNHLYAVWIKDRGWNMPMPYSDVYFSKSTDGGLTWSPSVTLNQPIHDMGNMPNPAIAPDGSIYVIWIDYNVLTGGLGTIFMNVSNDGGLTWLPVDIFVTAVNLPPLNLNGGTDVLAKGAAVMETSPFNPMELYIVYAEQVIGTPDEADIFFIKSLDGGISWTIPLRVNDDLTLNDQVMPWMDVKPNGIIDIVWYDRRNDPADMLWDVFMATSLNGGNSFLPNQQMNAVPAPSPLTPSGVWMGEYLGLVVDNTHAYIGFASAALDIQGDVFFAKVENPSVEIDFGDAPDPTYPTLLANDGARHIMDGFTYLGASVDPEPDGQPDANATGDDNDGNNDDDGVVLSPFTPVWTPGGSVWLDITATGNGYLSAWVDYNANGSWADPGEQILTDQLMTPGTNSYILTIPGYAEIGKTFARYRFSTLPGLSYTGLATDGEVEDYQILMEGDVDVDIKVFLEGAYNGSDMNTDLNDANLLPLTQPYGSDPAAKWYYTGTESVAVIPDPDITDWVLVEFRDAPDASQATGSTRVAQMAAFLKKDGSVVGLDGISPLKVYGVFQYQPYVVVWHRNHLGVLSANPLVKSGVNHYSYDFTTGAGQAYNGSLGHKDIGGGVYGMFSADGKPDGLIDSQDKSVWTSAAGNAGYDPADYNLDVQVDNKDKNEQWRPNAGEGTQVPN
jgi:hypothetical protein